MKRTKGDSDKDEHRDLAALALLKEQPETIVDREGGRVIVVLARPSEDGRSKVGLAYRIIKKKGEESLAQRDPEEVVLGAVPVTIYHKWLQEKSLEWLRAEAEARLRVTLNGTQPLAFASVLASAYQLEVIHERGIEGVRIQQGTDGDEKEVRAAYHTLKAKLDARYKWYRTLAEIDQLSEDQFYLLAVEGPTAAGMRSLKRLRASVSTRPAHRQERMMPEQDEVAQKELEQRRQKQEEKKAKPEGAEKAPEAKKEEKKPASVTKPKAEAKRPPKAPAKKPEPKAAEKKEEKPEMATATAKKKAPAKKGNARMSKADMLALQRKFKPGSKVRYIGKNEKYTGKFVTVKSLEKAPYTGVRIEWPDGGLQGVSPKSLASPNGKK